MVTRSPGDELADFIRDQMGRAMPPRRFDELEVASIVSGRFISERAVLVVPAGAGDRRSGGAARHGDTY